MWLMSEEGIDLGSDDFEVRHFFETLIVRCFLTFRCGFKQHWNSRLEAFSSEVLQIISRLAKLPLWGEDARGEKEVSEKLTVEGLD